MQCFNTDGSLNVKYIDSLPIEEYSKVLANFTTKQREEYYSQSPINEGTQQTMGVKFHSLEEVIKQGIGVNIEEYIKTKMNILYFPQDKYNRKSRDFSRLKRNF